MKMAEHLKNILGDMLYLVDPDENMEFLPSPEELQGKILVKAKKTSRKVKEPALPNTMIPPPPALDDDKDEENKSPSKNRDIDFLPKGDTSSDTTANSIPRVDDGLLPKSSQGWAGPPKVHNNILMPLFTNLFSGCHYVCWYSYLHTSWYGPIMNVHGMHRTKLILEFAMW